MKRTFTYLIPTEYSDKKIHEFLRGQGFSQQNLTDIRYKDYQIFVNSNRVFRNHVLHANDELIVVIDEKENSPKIIPVNIPIEIVYEDEDILVVNKPAKMPIHPSLNNYDNSLGNAVMFYYNNQGLSFVYRCINRLDRDTSGLVLIAKNIISANILGNYQKEGKINKVYQAIVEGEDIDDFGTIDKPIGRKDGSTIERMIDYENGKPAITHFKTIKRVNNKALVELKLETGRTHQIRVHMNSIGHPLVGDFLYNPNNKDLNRQALHVSSLSFTHPITREIISLECPLPEEMKRIIEELV